MVSPVETKMDVVMNYKESDQHKDGAPPISSVYGIPRLGRPGRVRGLLACEPSGKNYGDIDADPKFKLLTTIHENLRQFDKLNFDGSSGENEFLGFTDMEVDECIKESKSLREKLQSISGLDSNESSSSISKPNSAVFISKYSKSRFNAKQTGVKGKIAGGVSKLKTVSFNEWRKKYRSNGKNLAAKRLPLQGKTLSGKGKEGGRAGLRSAALPNDENIKKTESVAGNNLSNKSSFWPQVNENLASKIPEFEAPLVVEGKRLRRPNIKLLEKWETDDIIAEEDHSTDVTLKCPRVNITSLNVNSLPLSATKPVNGKLTTETIKAKAACHVCGSIKLLGNYYGSGCTCRTCAKFYVNNVKAGNTDKLVCSNEGNCTELRLDRRENLHQFCRACKFKACDKLMRYRKEDSQETEEEIEQSPLTSPVSIKGPQSSRTTLHKSTASSPRTALRPSLTISEFMKKVEPAENQLLRDWRLVDEELKLDCSVSNTDTNRDLSSDDAFALIAQLISDSAAEGSQAIKEKSPVKTAENVNNVPIEANVSVKVSDSKVIDRVEINEKSPVKKETDSVVLPSDQTVKRKRGRPSFKSKLSIEGNKTISTPLKESKVEPRKTVAKDSTTPNKRKRNSSVECSSDTIQENDKSISKSVLSQNGTEKSDTKPSPRKSSSNEHIATDKRKSFNSLNVSNVIKSNISDKPSIPADVKIATLSSPKVVLDKRVDDIIPSTAPASSAPASSNGEKLREPDNGKDEEDNQASSAAGLPRGPRIKHVCRRAAVALGKPQAMFAHLNAADDESDDDVKKPSHVKSGSNSPGRASKLNSSSGNKKGGVKRSRTRLVRCKKCESCLRSDCGNCPACRDMLKFGGQGKMKSACLNRACVNMQPGRDKKPAKKMRTNGSGISNYIHNSMHGDSNRYYDDDDDSSIGSVLSDISDVTSSSCASSDDENFDDDDELVNGALNGNSTSMALRKRKMNPFTRYLAMARDTRETRHRTDAKEWEAVAMAKYASDSVSLKDLGLLGHT